MKTLKHLALVVAAVPATSFALNAEPTPEECIAELVEHESPIETAMINDRVSVVINMMLLSVAEGQRCDAIKSFLEKEGITVRRTIPLFHMIEGVKDFDFYSQEGIESATEGIVDPQEKSTALANYYLRPLNEESDRLMESPIIENAAAPGLIMQNSYR